MSKHEMKFERAGEGYRVWLQVNGDSDDRHELGVFNEVEPGRWRCTPANGLTVTTEMGEIRADSIEEIIRKIGATVLHVPIPSNRLKVDTFTDLAGNTLQGLYNLAVDTKNIDSLLAVLTQFCGGILAKNIKQEKAVEARNKMFEAIDENIAMVRKRDEVVAELLTNLPEQLRELVEKRFGKGGANGA